MFEVPPLCENESDDAPNGSYDLISSFGTYTNQKPHRVSLKKLGWINGVNPLSSPAPQPCPQRLVKPPPSGVTC